MNNKLKAAIKTHNEKRISHYRDEAIACLEQLQSEDQTHLLFEACEALARLQTYMDIPAVKYPIVQDPSQ